MTWNEGDWTWGATIVAYEMEGYGTVPVVIHSQLIGWRVPFGARGLAWEHKPWRPGTLAAKLMKRGRQQ